MDENTIMPDSLPKADQLGDMYSAGVLNPLYLEAGKFEPPPISLNPNLPGSQIPGYPKMETSEEQDPLKYAEALKDHMENPESYAQDPHFYAKNWAFDGDYTGKNFKRYYNVPRVFKQIGFSPWIDNESEFNKRMTWWDDYKRALGQTVKLAGTSFVSSLPWNAWDPDTTDETAAQEMTKAHAIGHSGKTGVGGFFNNLTLDAGFTLGIGAEFALEELVMAAGSALTAAPSGGSSVAGFIAQAGAKMASAGRLLTTIPKMSKMYSQGYKMLESLADITKAREFFKAVKLERAGAKLVDAVSPNTLKFVKETIKTAKTGEKIKDMALLSKGVGAFYRDARMLAAALTESKLEGGMVEQELFEDLVNKHYESKGIIPTPEEYSRIREVAQNAGHETFLWNLPALWISNKIVLDKSFKGFRGFKEFTLNYGKGVKASIQYNKKNLGVAGKEAFTGHLDDLSGKLAKMKNPEFWYPKNVMKTLVAGVTKYGSANLTEGLQETYQDSMSKAMKTYYESIYNDPLMTSMHTPWGRLPHMGKAFKHMTTTEEGLQVFASGFLMGGLVQVPQHIVYEWLPTKFSQMKNPEQFKEYRRKAENEMDQIVKALNAGTKDTRKFFNENLEDLVIQKIHQKNDVDNKERDDVKNSKDSEEESVFNHIWTLLSTNKIDMLTTALKDMKNLSGTELEEAFGPADESQGKDAKQYYMDQIDGFVRKTEEIRSLYEYTEKEFVNIFNEWKHPVFSEEFFKEAYRRKGFEDAKKLAVFARFSFNSTLKRMANLTRDLGNVKILRDTAGHDVTILLNEANIVDEIDQLKEEVKAFKSGDAKQQKLAEKKQEKVDALEEYKTAIHTLVKSQERIFKTMNLTGTSEQLDKAQKEDYDKAVQAVKVAFYKYMKVLAKEKGQNLIYSEQLESALVKLLDFYDLSNNNKNLSYAVNLLYNPRFFANYAERSAKVRETIHKNSLEHFKTSYKAVKGAEIMNELINELLKIGVYFEPEQLEAFKNGRHPTEFLSATDGKVIPTTSKKYNEIEALLDKYEKIGGFEFTERRRVQDEKEMFEKRSKKVNDQRTYNDLAKQFGFNPDAAVSEVDAAKVLEAIANSPQATRREKLLAKRLKDVTPAQRKIKFVKNSGVGGRYSMEEGVVIDARYSASNYQNGNQPIEFIILHSHIQSLVAASLDNELEEQYDQEFSNRISELLTAAQQHHEGLSIDQKRVFRGLDNAEQFVAEALSNEEFQKFLQGIDYETTGKSTWEELVKAIRNLLYRVFGIKKGDLEENTLLNEALHVITTQIDKTKATKKSTKGDGTQQGGTQQGDGKNDKKGYKVGNKTIVKVITKDGSEYVYNSEGTNEQTSADRAATVDNTLTVYVTFASEEIEEKYRNYLSQEYANELIENNQLPSLQIYSAKIKLDENGEPILNSKGKPSIEPVGLITTAKEAEGMQLRLVRLITDMNGMEVSTSNTQASLEPVKGAIPISVSLDAKGQPGIRMGEPVIYVEAIEEDTGKGEGEGETEEDKKLRREEYIKTLRGLGYPQKLIDGWDIDTLKAEAEKNQKYVKPPKQQKGNNKKKEDLEAKKKQVIEIIKKGLEPIKTLEDLEVARVDLVDLVAQGAISEEEFNKIFEEKAASIPTQPAFDINDLDVGMIVLFEDGTQGIISKITKTKVIFEDGLSMTKKALEKIIKSVSMKPDPQITKDGKKESNDTNEQIQQLTYKEKIEKSRKERGNKTSKDLKNNINDCI